MRRNKNSIENIRGERKHQLRKYWTTYEKVSTMYDRLYYATVGAKVAALMDN